MGLKERGGGGGGTNIPLPPIKKVGNIASYASDDTYMNRYKNVCVLLSCTYSYVLTYIQTHTHIYTHTYILVYLYVYVSV